MKLRTRELPGVRRAPSLLLLMFLLCLVLGPGGGPGARAASADPSPEQEPPFSLDADWRFGVMGSAIGQAGFITADIDRDGVVEIVCGGSTGTFGSDDFWYIQEYQSATHEYKMTWVSDPPPAPITSMAAFDIGGAGIYRIFLGFTDGDVRVYDGPSLEEVAWIPTTGGSIRRILFADADNDGTREIVFCDDLTTYLCDPSTWQIEHQIPYGGSDFEVGNVDKDAAVEIVLAGGKVVQLTGTTAVEEWTYGGGAFGALIELSDFDKDGMAEIIGASGWYYITTFDADVQSPKWQIRADLDIDALLVTDTNGDGTAEVIYGDGQWGSVYCLDAVTTTEMWSISNPEHGVTSIAVFDTDKDGNLEVLWGCGQSSTGQDLLLVYGLDSRVREWESEHIDGPFDALDVGDVDGDGKDEIVFCSFSSESGYDDGVLVVVDAATKAVEWKSSHNLFGGYAWTGIHDLRIGDVDDDGQKEIVVATDDLYDGVLYVFNGATRVLEATYNFDTGAPMYSVAIADVDNDGKTEIVAGGGRENTGAPGIYVYVLNGATGAVEWKSINLSTTWSAINFVRVGDVDGNGVPDIVAILDSLFIINGVTHTQWQSAPAGYSAMDLCDVNGDGAADVILGTSGGGVVVLDGSSREQIAAFSTGTVAVEGVRGGLVDGDGILDIVVTAGGQMGIYSLDGSLLSQKIRVGRTAGRNNSLLLADTVAGGNLEILAGTDYAMAQVRVSGGTLVGDSDRDGLPDAWEETYFGAGNLAQGPAGDPDHDGRTNLQEYQAGTDPTQAPAPAVTPVAGGGGKSGKCGALGAEALLLIGILKLLRRRRRLQTG